MAKKATKKRAKKKVAKRKVAKKKTAKRKVTQKKAAKRKATKRKTAKKKTTKKKATKRRASKKKTAKRKTKKKTAKRKAKKKTSVSKNPKNGKKYGRGARKGSRVTVKSTGGIRGKVVSARAGRTNRKKTDEATIIFQTPKGRIRSLSPGTRVTVRANPSIDSLLKNPKLDRGSRIERCLKGKC